MTNLDPIFFKESKPLPVDRAQGFTKARYLSLQFCSFLILTILVGALFILPAILAVCYLLTNKLSYLVLGASSLGVLAFILGGLLKEFFMQELREEKSREQTPKAKAQ